MFGVGGEAGSLGVGNIKPSWVSNLRHHYAWSSDRTQKETQK
jgi:hypothetical protein